MHLLRGRHCARCFKSDTSQAPRWQILYPCFKKEEMDSERETRCHTAGLQSSDNNGNNNTSMIIIINVYIVYAVFWAIY